MRFNIILPFMIVSLFIFLAEIFYLFSISNMNATYYTIYVNFSEYYLEVKIGWGWWDEIYKLLNKSVGNFRHPL
jgi:hypothetical protein